MTIKVTGKTAVKLFDKGYSYKYMYLIKPDKRYYISVVLKQKMKENLQNY